MKTPTDKEYILTFEGLSIADNGMMVNGGDEGLSRENNGMMVNESQWSGVTDEEVLRSMETSFPGLSNLDPSIHYYGTDEGESGSNADTGNDIPLDRVQRAKIQIELVEEVLTNLQGDKFYA